uniref:Plexin b2b n=1 Tax=Cyprinus carpio TaxID=7962 RepID=A0A8C1JT50_CYPCA
MATWLPVFLLVLQVTTAFSEDPRLEFSTDTPINNVAKDPQTGRVYLGAVNAIYQLNSSLHLEARAETGPKKDARGCTPPVSTCQDLKDTNNTNKLLLVHSANGSLIVCGSLYRGICSLLNLTNVKEQIYYSDSKGERTYATSTEEHVSVVGVMATLEIDDKPFSVFLVGKGYGSMDSSKLISTRIVQNYRDWVVFESIIEASTVQAVPFVPKYLHDFRFAFKNDNFVYFLFSRTLGGTDNKNFTFVSRLCENDNHYYSYTELQLSCGLKNRYNKVQAAYLTEPGKELAQAITESGEYGNVREWDKVLFVVASSEEGTTESALCMYPLKNINQKLLAIVTACYTDNGKIDDRLVVESPYTSSKDDPCVKHSYKCGADFLPSPLASRQEFALKANPVFIRQNLLTAVAVAVENDHTVAFLGHNAGEVIKSYNSIFVRKRSIFKSLLSGNLLLCSSWKYISKVPVQACHLKSDCQSCVAQRDPYCGWCVLEGRCTRRSECSRAEEKNGWLWSPNQQCVKIVSFHPPNLSCLKSQQISVDFSRLRFPDCPRFENPDPVLIPVGYKTRISFEGINLDPYKVSSVCTLLKAALTLPLICLFQFSFDKAHETNVLFHVRDKHTGKKIDSSLSVTLYNCSLGREDCSLCKNADPKYQCVWCTQSSSCVYDQLCASKEPKECPDPQITDITPRFGPLEGGIAVTIKGSNLGIQKDDIKNITVAGVPCKHLRERYSVSTSVVCEIGSAKLYKTGEVEIEVGRGKKGISTKTVRFTYRDPVAQSVSPNQGPKAGGTVLTISGIYLHTASKEDLQVMVDNVPCRVGGRQIMVVGSGFDLVQKATIKVVASAGESLSLPQFVEGSKHKNDTVIMFLSPAVNESQFFRTYVQLDDLQTELTPFEYHPDPTFDRLNKTAGGFHARQRFFGVSQGRGFSKAMTAKEAQAFVGDAPCNVNTLQDEKLFLDPPSTAPSARSKRQRRDTGSDPLDLVIKFGNGEWLVGSVRYERKYSLPLPIIIPAVVVPMLLIIAISVVCYRRKSQQAEREYEKVKHQLENLEESVRDRCKKEFTDLMIEMEDHSNDISEGRIPFLDYKTYTDRVFFLPSKDGANDVMITGKLDIPESRRATVTQALSQFSNLLNSKTFLINFIRTLEGRPDFNARAKVYFASLLTVALHGKLEYYTDIMRTLLLGLMEDYVHSKNPKLLLRRSETVVERMLSNWMSICLYQFLKDTAGEPLYKLFRAIKHQIEKGPVDAQLKKAKYTLNDTGLLGDDVEYIVLTLQVLVQGEGPDITPVKVLNCDTISQVKEKIIEQVYKNLPHSQRPKVDSVTLEWRPGSTGQILSDLDVTSQKEGRWRRINTLAHYNVRDNATVVLSRVQHTQQSYDQNHDNHEERNALLEDDKVFHLVRPADELDEMKSKRGSIKDKSMTKAITEIYLTRLLSVKGTLQQFVDDFFRSVLCSGTSVPPAVKYFFDFLDEQALRHENVDEETIHIWKTNSLPLRFWVNILKNPHFIFDVHVSEVVDASLSVIAQTFMDACTKTEHKLSRDSPSNKLLYAKEISTYKRMVDEYYKGIRQMVSVSDQEMNTHLAEVSRSHTDKLNTQVALHQLYRYASKYYDGIIMSLDEDPAAQSKQLTLRLQQIAAALENKVTDL